MADRLYASKSVAEELSNDIDRVNMLGMKVGTTERSELMALGIAIGKRTPLTARKGFVREESIHDKPFESYIYSVALNELRKTKEENLISNKEMVYRIVEEYAQTGFDEIRKMFGDFSDYSEEECIDCMVEKMDELYESIKENQQL